MQRKPKVYFMGGSGVGKSTLAKYVSQKHGLPMLTGATKLALEHAGLDSFDRLVDCDIETANGFQSAVWRKQLELEDPYWKEEASGFVSDRSFDLLAYTAKSSRVAWQMFRSQELADYMLRMRGSINFFVRPHRDVKAKRDGRRDRFLSPEWVWGVDGVVEFLLEANEIPYVVISSGSFKDRCATVDAVLKLFPK